MLRTSAQGGLRAFPGATPVGPLPRPIEAPRAAVCYVRNPRMRARKSSANCGLGELRSNRQGRNPCQPRIRWDLAIPNHDPSIREEELFAAGPIFTSAP